MMSQTPTTLIDPTGFSVDSIPQESQISDASPRLSIPKIAANVDLGSPCPVLNSDPYDFKLPFEYYIPVGTLLISQPTSVSWANINPKDAHKCLEKKGPLLGLVSAEWVRIFSRCSHEDDRRSTVRIYALPNDVGRGIIDRTDHGLRKKLQQLLSLLDISREAWEGDKPRDAPCEHFSTLGNDNEASESLFYLFNTIPSPEAATLTVPCSASQQAIDRLFEPCGFPNLRTPLHPYQKRTAATMIRREVEPRQTSDPRFAQMAGPLGHTIFYDGQSGRLLKEPDYYEDVKGGVVAESMGLGKTLISLSAILATRGHWPTIPPQYSCGLHPVRPQTGSLMQMAAAAIGREQIPWRTILSDLSREGQDHKVCLSILEDNVGCYEIPSSPKGHHFRQLIVQEPKRIRLCSATIVIVPRNLLSQWHREIAQHFTSGTFNVLSLDVKQDTVMPTASELLQYDIILLTRQRFEQEMCPSEHATNTSDPAYYSPLRDLHFLRVIMDEGHQFATGTNRVCDALSQLRVDRKWLLSGTPSTGLLGVEVDSAAYGVSAGSANSYEDSLQMRRQGSGFEQERKDLKNLRYLICKFLQVQPWATGSKDESASWGAYILPDGQGRRKPTSLRNLLNNVFIRHRIEHIEAEVPLPPLYNQIAEVHPKWQDKLIQNAFIIALIANAVTSEREDPDYMHHEKNRPALQQLISNIRQSGFYWTSFAAEEMIKTLQVSREYLEKHSVGTADRKHPDQVLLTQAIENGDKILSSPSWKAFSVLHEMGIYVDDFPIECRKEWSLILRRQSDPLLMGATQLCKAQDWVDANILRDGRQLVEELANNGKVDMNKAWLALQHSKERKLDEVETRKSSNLKTKHKKHAKRAKAHVASGQPRISERFTVSKAKMTLGTAKRKPAAKAQGAPDNMSGDSQPQMKSALKPPKPIQPLTSDSHIYHSSIRGTASAKLSYLLDRVVALHKTEKILIFYEGDHIAYYIAQAFDLIGVRYLIYTQTLDLGFKSAYIASFNSTPTFRVMIMNIKEAAHGLHLASASRVFFVNPVWQPNIEAQAIKRAHRIGQTRPVYVETLVLKGTLEDQMLQRRKNMTVQEHKKAENSLLDDEPMTAIIKNASLLPLSSLEEENIEEQVAYLATPVKLFGQARKNGIDPSNPYADLVFPMETKKTKKLGIKPTGEAELEALLNTPLDEPTESEETLLLARDRPSRPSPEAARLIKMNLPSKWMRMDLDHKAPELVSGCKPQITPDHTTAPNGGTKRSLDPRTDLETCSPTRPEKRTKTVGFFDGVRNDTDQSMNGMQSVKKRKRVGFASGDGDFDHDITEPPEIAKKKKKRETKRVGFAGDILSKEAEAPPSIFGSKSTQQATHS